MEEENKQVEEPHGEEPASAQAAGTDWKAEARKWEQRAKENGARVKALEAAASTSSYHEEQLRDAIARAEKAEAEAQKLSREKEISEWKAEAARQTGIPADILRGTSMEEIAAHAAAIKAAIPSYQSLHDTGDHTAPPVTKEGIAGIKNEKERLEAIKNNLELFES